MLNYSKSYNKGKIKLVSINLKGILIMTGLKTQESKEFVAFFKFAIWENDEDEIKIRFE